MRVETEMHRAVRLRALAAFALGETRLDAASSRRAAFQLGVDAVVRDKCAIVACRERRRDRVWLAAFAKVGDRDAFLLQSLHGAASLRALISVGLHAEARGLDGGDHGAAADRRGEAIGLDLFAQLRQAIEADEDQIFEGFAGAESSCVN